jgi:hypothetical protein
MFGVVLLAKEMASLPNILFSEIMNSNPKIAKNRGFVSASH